MAGPTDKGSSDLEADAGRNARNRARPASVDGIALRLRLDFGGGRRIGPGKIDLIEAVGRTGSIAAAGREMGMSYRRAWLLVSAVNEMFDEPVVSSHAGGKEGGGAELTPFGRSVVASYRKLETEARVIAKRELTDAMGHLVEPAGS
jgi:molybdate transport system regulatory protein